jgi:Asp/Glu/hydantoin racemase
MKMRIWHQSFGDLTKFATYARTLERHGRAVADEDTEIVIHGTREGSYGDGTIAPINIIEYPYFHFLHESQIIEHALLAESEGFDGMAIGCFFDPGIRVARSLVDIPVLGLAESSLAIAISLGKNFAIITLCEGQSVNYVDLVENYGFSSRLAYVGSTIPPIDEKVLEKAFDQPDDVIARFVAGCEKAIDAGAEVIIPADGVLNEFLFSAKVTRVGDAPVLDAMGCLFKRTELFVKLRRRLGLEVSRRKYYAKPTREAVAQMRAFYELDKKAPEPS